MIRARGRQLVVKMPGMQEQTKSGLYIPTCAQDPPMEGIVLSVGCDVSDVKPKDRVMFEQYAGLEHKDADWGDVLIIEQDDLMGVLDA